MTSISRCSSSSERRRKSAPGLAPLARQDEEPEPGHQAGGQDAGDVDRDRAGRRDHQRAEPDRAGFGDRDRATALRTDRARARWRLGVGVVAVDFFLGPVGDRFEQAAPVVAELPADLADQLLFVLGQAAAVDVVV